MTLYGKKTDVPGLTRNPRGSISSTRGVYRAPPPPNLHEHSAQDMGFADWMGDAGGTFGWSGGNVGSAGEAAVAGEVAEILKFEPIVYSRGAIDVVGSTMAAMANLVKFTAFVDPIPYKLEPLEDASFLHALETPLPSGEDTELANALLQSNKADPDAESSSGAVANPYGEASISDNSSAGGNIVVLKQTAPGGTPPLSLPDEELDIANIATNLLGGTGLSRLRPEILAVFRSTSQTVRAVSDVPLESERDMITLRMRQGDVAHADVSRCMGQLAGYKYDTTTPEGEEWYKGYGETDSWLYVFWNKMLGKVDTITNDANVMLDILRKFREVEQVFNVTKIGHSSSPYHDTYVSKLDQVVSRRKETQPSPLHSPIEVLESNGFAPINVSDGVTSTQILMQLISDLELGARGFSFPFMEMVMSSNRWRDEREFKEGMYVGRGDDHKKHTPHLWRYCNLDRLALPDYRISTVDQVDDAYSRVASKYETKFNADVENHTSNWRRMYSQFTNGRVPYSNTMGRVALTCMLLSKELAVSAGSGWLNQIKDKTGISFWKSRDLGPSSEGGMGTTTSNEWKNYFQEVLGNPRLGLLNLDRLRISKAGNNIHPSKEAVEWQKSKLTDFLCIDLQDQDAQHTSRHMHHLLFPLEDRPVRNSSSSSPWSADDARYWFNQMVSPSQKHDTVGFFDDTALMKYRWDFFRATLDSTTMVRFLLDYPSRRECAEYDRLNFGDVDMTTGWDGPQENDHTDHLLPHMVFHRFLGRMQDHLDGLLYGGKDTGIEFNLTHSTGFLNDFESGISIFDLSNPIIGLAKYYGSPGNGEFGPGTKPSAYGMAHGWLPFWLGRNQGNSDYKSQIFSLLLMYRDRRNYDRARQMKSFHGYSQASETKTGGLSPLRKLDELDLEGTPRAFTWTGPSSSAMHSWELTPTTQRLGMMGYSSKTSKIFFGPTMSSWGEWVTETTKTSNFLSAPGWGESKAICNDVARRIHNYFGTAAAGEQSIFGGTSWEASYQAQAYAKGSAKTKALEEYTKEFGFRGVSRGVVVAAGILNEDPEIAYRYTLTEKKGDYSSSDFNSNHYGDRLLQMIRGENTVNHVMDSDVGWVFRDILEFVEELQQLASARSCRGETYGASNYRTHIPGDNSAYGDVDFYVTGWHNLGQDFFLAPGI